MKVRFVRPELSDPARDRGIQVPYAPAKRQLARWRWYLILLVVSSPLLYFVTRIAYSAVLVEAPGFVQHEQLEVRVLANGFVEAIFVKPLDEVQQNDPIARVVNPDLALRAGQLQAELRQLGEVEQELRSDQAHIPPPLPPPPPVSYQAQIEIAQQQRAEFEQRLLVLENLAIEDAATEGEVAAARHDLQAASARLAELQHAMHTAYQQAAWPTQPQPQPVNQTYGLRTRAATLRTELASLREQFAHQLVRAPRTGRIVDVSVIEGSQVAVGSKLAVLAPEDTGLEITAYVPPRYAEYAVQGQTATVIFPDGERHHAQVTGVPDVMQEVPRGDSALYVRPLAGVVVRLAFIGALPAAHGSVPDGLPVKLRFQEPQGRELLDAFGARVVQTWDQLRQHLTGEPS